VYVNGDPRAYPMSSYSYLIVPKTTVADFTTDKGRSLGAFILYVVCAGQTKAAQLGYSPLPKNLVGYAPRSPARSTWTTRPLHRPDRA
jgi:phosphate transport system substrate-binding protein